MAHRYAPCFGVIESAADTYRGVRCFQRRLVCGVTSKCAEDSAHYNAT